MHLEESLNTFSFLLISQRRLKIGKKRESSKVVASEREQGGDRKRVDLRHWCLSSLLNIDYCFISLFFSLSLVSWQHLHSQIDLIRKRPQLLYNREANTSFSACQILLKQWCCQTAVVTRYVLFCFQKLPYFGLFCKNATQIKTKIVTLFNLTRFWCI